MSARRKGKKIANESFAFASIDPSPLFSNVVILDEMIVVGIRAAELKNGLALALQSIEIIAGTAAPSEKIQE